MKSERVPWKRLDAEACPHALTLLKQVNRYGVASRRCLRGDLAYIAGAWLLVDRPDVFLQPSSPGVACHAVRDPEPKMTLPPAFEAEILTSPAFRQPVAALPGAIRIGELTSMLLVLAHKRINLASGDAAIGLFGTEVAVDRGTHHHHRNDGCRHEHEGHDEQFMDDEA